MAESDSDAFESADEEVEDRKQKKDVKTVIHEKKDTDHKPEVKSEKPVPVETPVEDPQPKVEAPTSSWRSWGAFNVISNASKTVASITTHVSQSIIDSMNIPDPEEMARMQAEEKKKVQASEDNSGTDEKSSEKSDDSRFKLDSLLSGVSQISSKVVSGGLDTLEGIGKKTINILQETDPNIKNKIRNINNQPNLSDLLKEAKDREESPPTAQSASPSYSFEHLLDEYKGMVFLEALEILSNQSKMKIDLLLKPLNGKVLAEMQETLDEVKELCELDTENFDESITADNVESKLQAATEDLNVKLNFNDIVTHSKESQQWLDELDSSVQPSSIYQESIHVMAKACALSLNNFQKLAELLLSQDHRSTADESDSLTQLASIYCSLFNHFATKFNEKLTSNSSSDESKKLATNVFLESSNAITQIRKAFSLFLPILQIGAV